MLIAALYSLLTLTFTPSLGELYGAAGGMGGEAAAAAAVANDKTQVFSLAVLRRGLARHAIHSFKTPAAATTPTPHPSPPHTHTHTAALRTPPHALPRTHARTPPPAPRHPHDRRPIPRRLAPYPVLRRGGESRRGEGRHNTRNVLKTLPSPRPRRRCMSSRRIPGRVYIFQPDFKYPAATAVPPTPPVPRYDAPA